MARTIWKLLVVSSCNFIYHTENIKEDNTVMGEHFTLRSSIYREKHFKVSQYNRVVLKVMRVLGFFLSFIKLAAEMKKNITRVQI